MKSSFFLSLALWLGLFDFARADVVVPSIFSQHAVLQKSAQTPVWGQAEPGEKVHLTLGAVSAETEANAQGRWRTTLDLTQSGAGPFELIIQGKNRLTISDILVGKIWLCSGQSNMEWSLDRTSRAAEDIAKSSNPALRHFRVERQFSTTPLDTVKGTWVVASPETTPRFSAIAYYFGKALQEQLHEPIGLINNSWGGSSAESWVSSEALNADPALREQKENALAQLHQFPALQQAYIETYRRWEKTYQREDRPSVDPSFLASEKSNTKDWKTVTLPNRFATCGLPASGAVWLRRTVQITPDLLGHNLSLQFGIIDGFDTVYFNGKLLTQTTLESPGSHSTYRRYSIPSNQLQVGPATIALRIFNAHDNGAFLSSATQLRLGLNTLSGDWEARTEFELPPLTAEAKKNFPTPPVAPIEPKNTPTLLFNGMLHPLLTYGIEGIIWYQGESNAARGHEYRRLFPLLIRDWRAHWTQGEVPFYFCQLANYNSKPTEPGESGWAELREAQTLTLKVPNTGQAILIDIGEELDIHPRNKAEAGERLSRLALAQLYGKKITASGPVFRSMQHESHALRLHFDSTDGGIIARPLPDNYQPRSTSPQRTSLIRHATQGELEGFAICGTDRRWYWANARIERDDVIVWSDQVPQPVAVRYAWADNPTCNLYNRAGLPAGPFRTDDFPLTSAPHP